MSRSMPSLAVVALMGAFAVPAIVGAQPKDGETKPTRRILALGGGGFRGLDGAVPRYFLSLTGKKNPVVYFLPTAVGDSDKWIVEWYETMNELECRPRHLKLFSESPHMKNLEKTLLSADAIYVNGGNTLNMIAIWKAHGVDKILKKAYERGIVLGGESAGMICWFEQANTDSRPEKLTAMECLGFLKGSACPHYTHWGGERKTTLHKMILDGELKDCVACSDYAALLYENDKLARVFTTHGFGGKAFHVRNVKGKIVEEEIKSEKFPIVPRIINLWPGRPADDDSVKIGDEKFFQLMIKGKPHEVDGKPTKWLTNVTTPTLTIYAAFPHDFVEYFEKKAEPRPAVLICPGGGYHNLGWDVEGTEVAEWFSSIGVTAIILKYRCPRRPGDEKGVPPAGPLKDAQRAISLLRANAREWNIDPGRIGMVGFSAGGHLVGSTCTNFEQRTYAAKDEVDKVSCRPDFGIMLYSGYFKVEGGLTPTVKTPKNAPPMLFVHAKDDAISDFTHSETFHKALKAADLDSSLILFDSGGHGFGVRRGSPCYGWTKSCVGWLRNHGVIKR